MNKLLQLQLEKHFLAADQVPGNLTTLLEVISDSYDHYENERRMIVSSMELTSKEMIDLNSELKKEKEDLKKAHKDLRQIIDLVPHFIFAKNAIGQFILANEAVANTYGCTVASLIGKSDADFNPNREEVEHFMQEDMEVIHSGNARYNLEETVTDADGSTRILSTTKIPYTSPGGGHGVLGVSIDISERKKAETILRESESQLAMAARIARLGYWEFDVLKGLFTFNDQFYNIFKTTAENVGGYTMTPDRYAELFVYREDRGIVGKEVAEAINSHDPYFNHEIEHRIVYADGETGYISVHIYLIKDGDGRTIKTFGVNQDITERKVAEQLIRNSEERYRQIVETAQEGIWMIDENNKTIFVNKRMCEMLGYSAKEMLSKDVFNFMDEEGKRIAAENIEERKKDGSGTLNFKFITKDGVELWTYISHSTVLDDSGKYMGALAMITDITQQKLDEELLRQSEINLAVKNKELEQKNKELEQFAYVASHDMQEPLRTTSSFVDLLRQQYTGKLDDKADKYLGFISQSTERMKVLIKDLLDYSRIGRKKELTKVDCSIMLTEVLADLGAAINETHAEIKTEQLPVVSGYPTELKQLFQNLIINAIKFRKKTVAPEINISVQRTNGCWQFVFADNGIGISKEHHERIFIIFQRLHTRNEYEGTGIGLSHCKKIVELHKGNIWVESTPGEGSAFCFTISNNN